MVKGRPLRSSLVKRRSLLVLEPAAACSRDTLHDTLPDREAMRDKAGGLFSILLATVAGKSSAGLLHRPRLVDDFVFGVKPVLKG
jgi:hypothetical protein